MSLSLITLSPLISLFTNFLIQTIALKTICKKGVISSVILGAIGGEIFFLFIVCFLDLRSGTLGKYIFLGQIAYLCTAFCYFAFINLNTTSVRIRILEELRSVGGQAPLKTIMDIYGSREIVKTRLNRMTFAGLLFEDNGRYYIGKKYPLLVARFMDSLRAFLLKN